MITAGRGELFARAGGDANPLHLAEQFARGTRFGRWVAHGMLAGGIIGGMLGTEFPGRGTISLSRDIKFICLVYVDDLLTIKLAIKEIIIDKKRLINIADVSNQRGEKAAPGTATVPPPAG